MKQLKIKIFLISGTILLLTSCLKKDVQNVDIEETTGSIVTLQFIENGSGSTINSGMQYFSGGALTYPKSSPSDTAHFNVSVSGSAPASKDTKVTIGIKADAILDNYASDSIKYELMPDSLYSIITPTATIAAGTRLAPLEIAFFPSKVDISKSYMLPIIVTDAQGLNISGSHAIIYFHIIGNPLAGTYTMTGTRYNFSGSIAWLPGDAVPPPGNNGITPYDADIVASPVNDKTVQMTFGNVPYPGVSVTAVYQITGDATFSNITYGFTKQFTDGYSNIIKYVESYTPPSATTKASFHLITKYNNAQGNAGSDRLIDQTFTQQ